MNPCDTCPQQADCDYPCADWMGWNKRAEGKNA
nr:MAG TPA_asm: hypothetical protein [Caudoviricetes sp.]